MANNVQKKTHSPKKLTPPDPFPFQEGGEATPLISIQASEMSPSALHKTSAGISPLTSPFYSPFYSLFYFPFYSLFNSPFYSLFYSLFNSPFYSLFYFS